MLEDAGQCIEEELECTEKNLTELKEQIKETEVLLEERRKEMEELEKQLNTARYEANQQLQDTGKAYREAVEKGAEIDSTMLHDDAKLLQLDMKMTAHQFEALVEKHKDNPLMAQLLQEYSDKHEGLYTGYLPTAEAKINAFDSFVAAAQNTLRTPDSLSAAMFQEGKYIPVVCTESE